MAYCLFLHILTRRLRRVGRAFIVCKCETLSASRRRRLLTTLAGKLINLLREFTASFWPQGIFFLWPRAFILLCPSQRVPSIVAHPMDAAFGVFCIIRTRLLQTLLPDRRRQREQEVNRLWTLPDVKPRRKQVIRRHPIYLFSSVRVLQLTIRLLETATLLWSPPRSWNNRKQQQKAVTISWYCLAFVRSGDGI